MSRLANEARSSVVWKGRRQFRRAAFFLILFSICSFSERYFANAQEKAAEAKPSPEKKDAPGVSPAPSNTDQKQESPLKKAVKEKKVLTEDDLRAKPKAAKKGNGDESEVNPVCNSYCEEMVRTQLGIEPEHELEFRNHFRVASQEVAEDQEWGKAIFEASTWAENYCNFKRKYPRPEGAGMDYQMEDIWLKYKDKEGMMLLRLKNAIDMDAFRAAIMRNEWNVESLRVCGNLNLP